MVTCDRCGIELNRHVFCSSKCKMSFRRAVTNGNIVTKGNKTVTESTPVTNGNKDVMNNYKNPEPLEETEENSLRMVKAVPKPAEKSISKCKVHPPQDIPCKICRKLSYDSF